MVELIPNGVYLLDGKTIVKDAAGMPSPDESRENTITYGILRAHDVDGGKGKKMRIRFDAMVSHDITYVGIIQTARASGLKEFPLPYAMTNCHNSLCAVGGTINEDDHVFGLSAAKKYGGIYVPANQAVIHQYAREALTKCGNMILGSDSHTRLWVPLVIWELAKAAASSLSSCSATLGTSMLPRLFSYGWRVNLARVLALMMWPFRW